MLILPLNNYFVHSQIIFILILAKLPTPKKYCIINIQANIKLVIIFSNFSQNMEEPPLFYKNFNYILTFSYLSCDTLIIPIKPYEYNLSKTQRKNA